MKGICFALAISLTGVGQAFAFPTEAVTGFFAKVFKGGIATKEAALVGRTGEGAMAARGVERVSASDAAQRFGSGFQLTPEPTPNLSLEPFAKNRGDTDAYKSLRVAATNGDAKSMLRMADMTASGKVSDPGIPYHGYWLVQASRAGLQNAMRRLRDECAGNQAKRVNDRWFDSACQNVDGKTMYVGGGPNLLHSPLMPSSSIFDRQLR